MNYNYSFNYQGIMQSSVQSIPLGGGDLGANVWANGNTLYLLLSHANAFSELGRLLKTGLLCISFENHVFDEETKVHLDAHTACLTIKSHGVNICVFVDANNPVYSVSVESDKPISCTAHLENYRSLPYKLLPNDESNYAMGAQSDDDFAGVNEESADIVYTYGEHAIGQYHRNETSCYEVTMAHQGLQDFPFKNDPLLNRTFGCLAVCEQMKSTGERLQTIQPITAFKMQIYSISKQTQNLQIWKDDLIQEANTIMPNFDAHCATWEKRWKRSYIIAKNSADAEKITQGYWTQRYMNLCAGHSNLPVHFNGSIFTCQPSPYVKTCENYDYRRWGSLFWFQNTRLVYWNSLYSGDYDLMPAFFDLFFNNKLLAEYRAKLYYGASGIVFPETITLFGTYANKNYGENRGNKPVGDVQNRYIRYHFEGMLEFCTMLLHYCEHVNNKSFLNEKVLPYVQSVLLFFQSRFELWDGKLLLQPSSSLETWQCCADDTPTIAGLQCVTRLVLALPEVPQDIYELCAVLQTQIPELPHEIKCGQEVLAPCRVKIDMVSRNVETPELYAVFPFDRVGLHHDCSLGRATYAAREETSSCGWQQHGIQAARLGLVQEAKHELLEHYSNTNSQAIFPAFWGPNYDWLPDQDNGCAANIALTQTLVQVTKDGILLLPAWDINIDVEFRLPVGNENFVQLRLENGVVQELTFDVPPLKNVVVCGIS
ncbi:MAG: DUF5703 domain-containing protein [Oscillospiraceae bacterium]